MSNSVSAARVHEPGGRIRLDELDLDPSTSHPHPGEVAVKMHLAGVNPLDGYVLDGRVGADAPYPRILGVEGVGERAGQPVVVFGCGVGMVRNGTWAELALVPAEALVPVPTGVPLDIAAACGVVGPTAIRVVQDLAAPTPDDQVLVLAASGAVGMAACSLLRSIGVATWGQTTSPDKAAGLAEIGATPLVADSPKMLIGLLGEQARPTVVLDALGGGWTSAGIEVLRPRGRLVSYGTSVAPRADVDVQAFYRKSLTWHGYSGIAEPLERVHEAITRALQAVLAGQLQISTRPPIPLDRAQQAIELVRSREGMGKVLLDLRG